MSNERDRISEYFEAKGVSRGEFEALKRFGDYKEHGIAAEARREQTPITDSSSGAEDPNFF